MLTRRLSSPDMSSIRVRDFEKLKAVLEDLELMAPVYKAFVRGNVVSAEVKMYPHSSGVKVDGVEGGVWLYVNIKSGSGVEYDAALWKVINAAEKHPKALRRIMECLEVE